MAHLEANVKAGHLLTLTTDGSLGPDTLRLTHLLALAVGILIHLDTATEGLRSAKDERVHLVVHVSRNVDAAISADVALKTLRLTRVVHTLVNGEVPSNSLHNSKADKEEDCDLRHSI